MISVFIFPLFVSYTLANKIGIMSPPELRDRFKKGIDYNIVNFGYVPYGQSIHGEVRYLQTPCTPIQGDNNHGVFFYMLDRDVCSIAWQAHVAQEAGASMLIVVDSIEEDIHLINVFAENMFHIHIPVLIISKLDGNVLKQQTNVLLSTTFFMPQRDIVKLDYFMSSMDRVSYKFPRQFHKFYKHMKENVDFNPRYVQSECEVCKKQQWTISNDDCLSGGRYCATDPDGTGPLLGRDVVFEDLRQLCIFQSDQQEWWHYVKRFHKRCLHNQSEDGIQIANLTSCSYSIMEDEDIDKESIRKCVYESFIGGNPIFNDSKILKEERQIYHSSMLSYWPSLLINQQAFRGDLYYDKSEDQKEHLIRNISNYAALEAICSGFKVSLSPEVCNNQQQLLTRGDDLIIVNPNGGMSPGQLWTIVILLLVAFMVITFYCYKRLLRKQLHQQMTKQVQQSLSQYYRFDAQKGVETREQL